jgi:FMN phosphatase YigB (HAD superfamily)
VLGGIDAPEKPDVRIFRQALSQAGVPVGRAVYVGNRLDTDVRGSLRAGLRSVWMLRGEAPPAPTAAQLDEPDAVITSLTGLPMALARIAGRSGAPVSRGAAVRHVGHAAGPA